jgi:hypothetical protein
MDSLLVIATLLSLGLGTAMTVIAWRLLRQNADRRAARIEALQSLAGEPVTAPPSASLRSGLAADDFEYAPAAPVAPLTIESHEIHEMFEAPEGMPERRWLPRLALAAIIVAVAALPYFLYSFGVFGAIASAAPANAQPIELLSLRHNVDDTGAFSVTGLVHNPQNGRKTSDVVAVVYLFDEAGRFVATGRGTLDVGTLQPGEDATFIVSIPKAPGVSRYRVGFRLSDGGVIAHVDRRGQQPADTTEDSVGAQPPGRAIAKPFLPQGRSEGE